MENIVFTFIISYGRKLRGSMLSLHSQYLATHQVPQPEKPKVWMKAKTHWRKKMKKKAMKLNELSALQTTRQEYTKDERTNKVRVALYLYLLWVFLPPVLWSYSRKEKCNIETRSIIWLKPFTKISNFSNTSQHYINIINSCDVIE